MQIRCYLNYFFSLSTSLTLRGGPQALSDDDSIKELQIVNLEPKVEIHQHPGCIFFNIFDKIDVVALSKTHAKGPVHGQIEHFKKE